MSEMTQIPENIKSPTHKHVWFALLTIIGYIVAVTDSLLIYYYDGYSVFIENNSNFNLLMSIGWPLTSIWDLYQRFLVAHGSANFIWSMWIILLLFVYFGKNRISINSKMLYLIVSVIAILIAVVISYMNIAVLDLGIGATEMLGMVIVLTPVLFFLTIVIAGGEYLVFRKQVASGTFLMDQYVPSFDYID